MQQIRDIRNPFPGLRSFEPEEAHLFFGRETQIKELTDRLSRVRFLAVVGTSGCGKSSLVRAGLLPGLSHEHTGMAGEDWRILLFKPGNDPFGNLSKALFKADEVTGKTASLTVSPEDILPQLQQAPEGFTKVVKEQGLDKNNLLIVVDQFEELFTFHTSEKGDEFHPDAENFVRSLLYALEQSDLPVYVVLTMRSDFLGHCTEFNGLTEMINEGQYLIPRMTQEERRLAITGPIELAGGNISDRLVSRMLKEAGEGQDQLPLMQHALMRMWEYWQNTGLTKQPIDTHVYEAVGRIDEALSIHAEEAYSDLETDRQKYICEVMFKALTKLGAENRGTRRPTRIDEICQLADATEEEVVEVANVFRKTGRAFLMPPSKFRLGKESILDISHESLMRKWHQLTGWVEDEIKSAKLYIRLCEDSMKFQEGAKGTLGNPELQLALNWRKESRPNLTWARRYNPHFERAMNYLDLSEDKYVMAITAEEERQRLALGRAKRFTIILGGASLISLLILLVALNLKYKAEDSEKRALRESEIAVNERKNAEEQTKEAVVQKRISEQQQEIAHQQRLIAEEQRIIAQQQSNIASQQTVIANQERSKAEAQKEVAEQERDRAEEQEEIAKNERDRAEVLREKAENSEANTRRLRLLAIARNIAIRSSNMDAEEAGDLDNLLALQAYNFNRENGGHEREADIYRALSKSTEDELRLAGHEEAVRTLCYSPDGKYLVSGGESGELLLWTLNGKTFTKQEISQGKKVPMSAIRSLAIDPKSRFLVAGNFGGYLQVWDLKNLSAPLQVIEAHTSLIPTVAFLPDGFTFFSGGADGKLERYKFTGSLFEKQRGNQYAHRINDLALSPDGNTLACAMDSDTLWIIDVTADQSPPRQWATGMGNVKSVAFSQDNRFLAVGGKNGKISLLEHRKSGASPTNFTAHNSAVVGLEFSPTSKFLVSVSLDRTGKIWSYQELEVNPIVIDKHDSWVWDVAISPDGNKIVTASQDKAIRLISSDSELMVRQICDQVSRNMTEAEWKKYIGEDIPYQKSCENRPLGEANEE